MPFQILQGRFFTGFLKTNYRILIQSNKNYTDQISLKYSDVPVGEMLARFNQLDLLEISINGANVSELLSLSIGSVCVSIWPIKKHHLTDLF
jgi:S-adenosylmethionine hydrolase